LIDWCVLQWHHLSTEVSSERTTLEMVKEFKEMHKGQLNKDLKSEMLPLHEFLPLKGANATGTLLMFKREELQLRKHTKVQLYADQDKSNLLCQFDDVSKWNLKPKLIQSNTVWMTYDEGNPELFEYDEVQRPRIECAMV